ncbi:MAG: serine hydrolase domain-containing protein [Segniliparus sp.]|uniref:serine hydrolase domain-containing protein n=1 Tax=Segniliparus sp. TaxID=2804064 RepID=UPI003F3689D6
MSQALSESQVSREDEPQAVHGTADLRFQPLVRAFGKVFADLRPGGGALAVWLRGEPVVDVWAGTTDAAGAEQWERNSAPVVFSASKGLSSIVAHRLADRGLVDYEAPVAEYWPEFAANGKAAVRVRDVLNHTAGLSQLPGVANNANELLDHRLMEERLAAAPLDRFAGRPAYHALTLGWLLSGLARAVTGKDMRELYQAELAAPLGIDGVHLGRPASDSSTRLAPLVDPYARFSRLCSDQMLDALARRRATRPLAESVYAGSGSARILNEIHLAGVDAQMPAANAVATARALATIYAAIAGDGSVGGARLLSPAAVARFPRKRSFRFDRVLGVPMMWHMGFHSAPLPGLVKGFGHVGAGGCFGWADPARGLSVALVHNRLPSTFVRDLGVFTWVVPLALRAVRRAGSFPG